MTYYVRQELPNGLYNVKCFISDEVQYAFTKEQLLEFAESFSVIGVTKGKSIRCFKSREELINYYNTLYKLTGKPYLIEQKENGIAFEIPADKEIYTETLIIPNTVTTVFSYTFEKIEGLKHLVLSDTLERLEQCAVVHCKILEKVTFGKRLRLIGDYCFLGCCRLRTIKLPKSLLTLGSGTFQQCENLEEVDLSESCISKLPKGLFNNCEKLKTVKLPETITEIGKSVFYCCKELKSITIPSNVVHIENTTFLNCTSLNHIRYEGTNLQIANTLLSELCEQGVLELPNIELVDLKTKQRSFASEALRVYIENNVVAKEYGLLNFTNVLLKGEC